MPTIETCGNASVRRYFDYTGSVNEGIRLKFGSTDFCISAENITSIINHFKGQRVAGGFSMTNPPGNSVGAFVQSLGSSLTPRHASFICAILQHEGYAKCTLNGNAVMVHFN